MHNYNDEIIALSSISGDIGNVRRWRQEVIEIIKKIESKTLEAVKNIPQDRFVERNQFNKIYFDNAVDVCCTKDVGGKDGD